MTKKLIKLNHSEEFKEKLLEQYKRSPQFNSLIESFTEELNYIEEEAENFNTLLSLNAAEGVNLDYWGIILNSPTRPTDDDAFRQMLKGLIGAYYSEGTNQDILSFVNLAIPNSGFYLQDNEDATFSGTLINPTIYFKVRFLKELLNSATCMGVQMLGFKLSSINQNDAFAFSTDTKQFSTGPALIDDQGVKRFGGFYDFLV